MKYRKLTTKEENIILHKGTERAFSGEYDDFFRDGVYICRRCGTPLYDSKSKFNSGCGWPSFDQEIANAVDHKLDADGMRTEILCQNCGAHLGHVFSGEKLTAKDTRHCVNSLSMLFVQRDFKNDELQTAVFGGGCFWCLEAAFQKVKGVSNVVSGYAGGSKENPTYEEVSSGKTGHAEVVKIEFNPKLITFESLLEIFFTLHDPTTLNKQGADEGEQYRSAVFYLTWRQKQETEKMIANLEKEKVYENKIVTEVNFLEKFYPAEDYHQNYYAKHPEAAYCQVVIAPKLAKLKTKVANLLKE